MFDLKVISVNGWAILASLANLLILTCILKKFLFKPVKKIVDSRRAAIDEDYAQAKAARDASAMIWSPVIFAAAMASSYCFRVASASSRAAFAWA